MDLVTRRGSELALNGSSELTLANDGRRASLRQGRLYLRNRDKEFAAVTTEVGLIEMLGTTISAAVKDRRSVEVTVVEGKVRLVNDRGQAVVEAGNQSILTEASVPQPGAAVNVAAELAWHHGRSSVLSDFGDIAYAIRPANGLYTEVWVMHPDGSGKRRLCSFVGGMWSDLEAVKWLPGTQWLLANTGHTILGWSDRKPRSMFLEYGHSMLTDELWLLNAATGQAMPIHLPYGFRVHYGQVSPDGRRLAFPAWYRPVGSTNNEGGIWTYNFDTGVLRKLVDGHFKTPLAWSPDSKHLVLSSSQTYEYKHELIVVDAETGDITKLGLPGAGAVLSPDGRRLAYCSEFAQSSGWYQGVPESGSIWVADVMEGGAPWRISPSHEGALLPQWSPNGRRVAYLVNADEDANRLTEFHTILRVADADGSEVMTLGEFDRAFSAFAWAPRGDAIYAVTMRAAHDILAASGVLRIATDGSGQVTELGGTETDSVLPVEVRRQTEAAAKQVQEALFQFAVAETAQFEGKLTESRKAFRDAADIFAGIAWKYPRSGFSPDDLIRYADEATSRAKEPTRSILQEVCRERQDILSRFLWRFASKNGRFPHDLAELRTWMVEVRHDKPEEIAPLFSCPVGAESGHTTPYGYNSHASEGHLKLGDVVVSCPQHPDLKIAWDKDFLMRLGEVAAIPRDRLEKLGELP